MNYDVGCSGCERSQNLHAIPGGVIPLPGDWIINQYQGPEGWLGWLALQPRYHRDSIQELEVRELSALGSNLKAIDGALTQYWRLQFPTDPITRVYFVYLFESAFETPPPKERFHLHVHVIPRFESLANQLRCEENGSTWVDGWRAPRLGPEGKVPSQYSRQEPLWNDRVESMMEYLRHELR